MNGRAMAVVLGTYLAGSQSMNPPALGSTDCHCSVPIVERLAELGMNVFGGEGEWTLLLEPGDLELTLTTTAGGQVRFALADGFGLIRTGELTADLSDPARIAWQGSIDGVAVKGWLTSSSHADSVTVVAGVGEDPLLWMRLKVAAADPALRIACLTVSDTRFLLEDDATQFYSVTHYALGGDGVVREAASVAASATERVCECQAPDWVAIMNPNPCTASDNDCSGACAGGAGVTREIYYCGWSTSTTPSQPIPRCGCGAEGGAAGLVQSGVFLALMTAVGVPRRRSAVRRDEEPVSSQHRTV